MKILPFIIGCIVFFVFGLSAMITEKYIFRKFNFYPRQNDRLFSQNIQSRLLCFSACLEVTSCSLIIIRGHHGQGNKSYQCEMHSIRNFNNVSLIYEPELEIWYKRNVLIAMSEAMNPKTTDVSFETTEVYDITTTNPCPARFTSLSIGCFHHSEDWGYNWDEAVTYCSDGSQFVAFENHDVSQKKKQKINVINIINCFSKHGKRDQLRS